MSLSENAAALKRAICVTIVLCAFVCAQTVSLSGEHSHQHPSQHCCGLCHTGPLPFVPTSIGAAVLPPLAVIWLAFTDESGGVPEQLASIESSRAPPA